MANHDTNVERSRFVLLLGVIGVLIVAAVVAIVTVTTGSDPSSADPGPRADRGTPAANGDVSFAPAQSTESAKPGASSSPVGKSTPLPKMKQVKKPQQTKKPITYTVKRGDNLTVIAAWFKLHGYGDLYERNKAVIGKNPNLIIPGQKITVSSQGMTVSGDN